MLPPGLLALASGVLLALVLSGLLRLFTHRMERGPAPKPLVADPYRIAYLRRGAREVLDLAVFALIERKLLRCTARMAVADPTETGDPVEQLVLRHFGSAQRLVRLSLSNLPAVIDRHFRPEFEGNGWIASPARRRQRLAASLLAAALLIAFVVAVLVAIPLSPPWVRLVVAVTLAELGLIA